MPILAAEHVSRQRVYTALLAELGRDWTVSGMAERLPDVTVNDVRTALHLLLGDGLMDIEATVRHRSLTQRRTGDGKQILTASLREWEKTGPREAASAARGGRNDE